MLRFIVRLLIFSALTLLTQLGGLAYLIALAIGRVAGSSRERFGSACFLPDTQDYRPRPLSPHRCLGASLSPVSTALSKT
jgi:hypothetical protein